MTGFIIGLAIGILVPVLSIAYKGYHMARSMKIPKGQAIHAGLIDAWAAVKP